MSGSWKWKFIGGANVRRARVPSPSSITCVLLPGFIDVRWTNRLVPSSQRRQQHADSYYSNHGSHLHLRAPPWRRFLASSSLNRVTCCVALVWGERSSHLTAALPSFTPPAAPCFIFVQLPISKKLMWRCSNHASVVLMPPNPSSTNCFRFGRSANIPSSFQLLPP